MPSALQRLRDRYHDMNALGAAQAVLSWDQNTYMPHGGAPARAEHMGILGRMTHETLVSDETRRLLDEAESEADGAVEDRATLRLLRRDFDKATKIPTALVEEKARLSVQAHELWVKARREDDFAGFAPTLERMVELTRQEAEALGYEGHIYNALLDLYEEGATKADCDRMFDDLRAPLVALVKEIGDHPAPEDSFLVGDFDPEAQRAFTEELVQAIGFDFARGRQDTAPHPFCTNFSIGDVRLTTRFLSNVGSAVFGSLHEAGHGMYEQGSPMAWDRSVLAGGVSLGVHESQSRLWENIVGRSRAFWSHWLPKLQARFPQLASVGLDAFVRGINRVRPSLIRVEADELTYNLHIMVRFDLECALLAGEMKVRDIPGAWNAKYEEYLGVRPPTDADGCLQDVHWSAGLIGYFPTYSMGNLLSYQIWNRLTKDVPDAEARMAAGDCAPILTWLRERVYAKGKSLTPKDLVLQVTGKPMAADDYLTGVTAKYRALYGL